MIRQALTCFAVAVGFMALGLVYATPAAAVLIADPVRQTVVQRVQVPDDSSISMICLEFSDGGELCQTAAAGEILEFEFETSGCGTLWNAYAYNLDGLKSGPSETGVNFTVDANCDGFVRANSDLLCLYRMLFRDDFSCIKR